VLHKYIAASENACGYTFGFYEKHNHILKHLLEGKQDGEQARFYSWIRLTQQRKVSPVAQPRWRSGEASQPQRGHRHRPLAANWNLKHTTWKRFLPTLTF